MIILRNEIINKILTYREPHPIAKMLDTYCKRYRWPFIDFMELRFDISPPHENEISFFNYLSWKNISIQGCSECHRLSKFVLGGRTKTWFLHQPHFKTGCKNKNRVI